MRRFKVIFILVFALFNQKIEPIKNPAATTPTSATDCLKKVADDDIAVQT